MGGLVLQLVRVSVVLSMMYWMAYATAQPSQEESVKLAECNEGSFEVKFLPNSSILYLKVNQVCDQLIKELGNQLRNPEYNSSEVMGYVFDLQKSKISKRSDIFSGLASIFMSPGQLIGGYLNQGKQYSLFTGQHYYQPAEIKDDYLHELSSAFKSKPLALLVGESTDKDSDDLVLSFAKVNNVRSVALIGEDVKDGIWVNLMDVNPVFIRKVLKQFPVNNAVSDYVEVPNKAYLKYLSYLQSCSNNDLSKWKTDALSEIKKNVYYPIKAQRNGVEGDGLLEVELLPIGKIAKSKVALTTGNDWLDQAMLDAAKAAHIQPLSCLKPNVSTMIAVPFVFKLFDEVKKVE